MLISIFGKNITLPRQKFLLAFMFFPFILLLLIFVFLYKSPLYIIKNDGRGLDTSLVLSYYDDKSSNGNSNIALDNTTDGKICYRYTLEKGFPFPYVGIWFAKKDNSLFNLAPYDYVNIRLKSTKGIRIPFILMTKVDGFSAQDKAYSYRNSQYVLMVDDQSSIIKAPINQFETPDWWYTVNNKTEKELGPPSFSQVKAIQLNSCLNIKNGVEDISTIEEISFHVDLTFFYLSSGIFLFVYFSLGFIFLLLREKKAKPEINFQYTKMDVISHLDKDEKAVFDFITSNYSNAELSITDVQSAVGIHERKISTLIKNKSDLNFKQFLNKLRISEAKRLLSDTDLQVSEIAFKVGYGNASHFNRVFKTSENCSPNDFRKENVKPKQ